MTKKFTTRNNKTSKLTPATIGVVLLVLLLAVGGAWMLSKNRNSQTSSQPNDTQVNQIDYSGPTEDEKLAGNQQKDTILTPPPTSQTPTGNNDNKKSVNVLITDAGQYDNDIEVRSFISNHFEDGICTIELTKGSLEVTKETPAFKDSSTTICTNPLFKRNEFSSAGDWQVVVKYNSNSAYGRSEPRIITIK
ncbi:MAG: hypothetical protein M3Q14_03540 [bacterium]|nr:hypothetical protein [bacterium]